MKLITHNTYWFQGSPSLWGEEYTRAHPAIVASLIDLYGELRADVLCLQEVPGVKVFERLCAALGMDGVYAPGGERSVYGGGILWREMAGSVEDLTQRTVIDGRVFERICLRLDLLRDGVPLTVVDLHLASNRYAPDRQGEPLRLAEVGALFDACPEPDVVAGDFNARPDSGVYAEMISRGFVDSGAGANQHGRPDHRRIDYIWVRRDSVLTASDYSVVRGQDFRLAAKSPVDLSDHHPVSTALPQTERVGRRVT